MKTLALFISILIAVSAVSDEEQWRSFKSLHGKTYKSFKEEHYRFQIFKQNLREIETHNSRYEAGKETYEMGINQFTDLTNKEFQDFLSKQPLPDLDDEEEMELDPNYKPTLEYVNWREEGAVLPVQDQGNCGCCWAFSTAGAIEGQNYIKNNQSVALSVQDLLDCSKTYHTNGCRGGWPHLALMYVRDHGITSAKDYTYKAVQQACTSDKYPKVNVKVTGFALIGPNATNDDQLQQAVEKLGPISTVINATLFKNYKQGIFNPEECDVGNNHVVLTVGYGQENGLGYWLIKNSWGTKYGEDGYIRIIKNNTNICGMLSINIFPKVDRNE